LVPPPATHVEPLAHSVPPVVQQFSPTVPHLVHVALVVKPEHSLFGAVQLRLAPVPQQT
jgi:hypothetical protein